jgi:hypothetical protein
MNASEDNPRTSVTVLNIIQDWCFYLKDMLWWNYVLSEIYAT